MLMAGGQGAVTRGGLVWFLRCAGGGGPSALRVNLLRYAWSRGCHLENTGRGSPSGWGLGRAGPGAVGEASGTEARWGRRSGPRAPAAHPPAELQHTPWKVRTALGGVGPKRPALDGGQPLGGELPSIGWPPLPL